MNTPPRPRWSIIAFITLFASFIINITPAHAADATSFILKQVQFEGGTSLPQEQLNSIVAPYIGQLITAADVEQLRYQITKHYIDRGYINSGAVIKPNQTITDGVLTLQLIAGQLAEIRVNGQGRLRSNYIIDRLQPAPGAPFNRLVLQEQFQLLLQNPLIKQLQGNILPGDAPGSAVLDLTVTRHRPWELALRTDNYRPPSSGAERAYVIGTLRNLSGLGDSLDLTLGRGFGGGNEGKFAWSVPITTHDTRVTVRYEHSDSSLLEEPMAELDIESDTDRVALELSHPLWHDLRSSLLFALQLTYADNTTSLLGEPFSFSDGVVKGESHVTAVRLSQEYARRQSKMAYAVRSTLSYGLDALDSTIHPDGIPDSQFVTWLGQGQLVRQLTASGIQLIVRADVQFASERLLPLEHFAIGGINSVRGYRENQQVGDSGYTAGLELHYPLWEGVRWLDAKQQLQLVLFTDIGNAWMHGEFDRRDSDLWSVGTGLIWTIEKRLQAELYYGYALNSPPLQPEHNWQDEGIHGMVQINF